MSFGTTPKDCLVAWLNFMVTGLRIVSMYMHPSWLSIPEIPTLAGQQLRDKIRIMWLLCSTGIIVSCNSRYFWEVVKNLLPIGVYEKGFLVLEVSMYIHLYQICSPVWSTNNFSVKWPSDKQELVDVSGILRIMIAKTTSRWVVICESWGPSISIHIKASPLSVLYITA
jgi:hypothetical protein